MITALNRFLYVWAIMFIKLNQKVSKINIDEVIKIIDNILNI